MEVALLVLLAQEICPHQEQPLENGPVLYHLVEMLHDPGTEPVSLASPALAGRFTRATWEALSHLWLITILCCPILG